MAAAVERLLAPALTEPGRLTGLVSVPAGCGLALDRIETRETRPGGVNLPTRAAVAATAEMRSLLAGLDARDLAVVLVTGGGSALVEEPREGVSLDEIVARLSRIEAKMGGRPEYRGPEGQPPRPPMPPAEMREQMEQRMQEGRKRMEEARQKMEQARTKFQEMEERIRKLEAEVERLKAGK